MSRKHKVEAVEAAEVPEAAAPVEAAEVPEAAAPVEAAEVAEGARGRLPHLETAPETGTQRVIGTGGVRIPGPTIVPNAPAPAPVKKETAKPVVSDPGYVQVSSGYLVKHLAKNAAQNRLTRLQNLARTDRDVRWALDEISAKTISKKETNS